jgi:uncharacterized protein (TIGR01777 family)
MVPWADSYHHWQPVERGTAWAGLVGRARAVVHLASPLVAPGRWSRARRQEVYDACVIGTRGIVSALAEARSRPEVLVCASSVGYYGFDPSGERCSDEGGEEGEDFTSRLMADWESTALRAERFGVRTVVLRLGLVVAGGGVLAGLGRAARLGLGGPLAPGSQLQPWVDVADVVGLLRLALADQRLSGPLNVVAPQAVTQAAFMAAVCACAGAQTGLRQPGWLLRGRFGTPALAVTQGRGAAPARALELGYHFRQPDLGKALAGALSPPTASGRGHLSREQAPPASSPEYP